MIELIVSRIFGNEHKTLSECEIIKDGKTVYDFVGIELPWMENRRNVSCIPAGIYEAIATRRASSGAYALLIRGVINRSQIMVHTANYARDLQGCLAPGREFKDIDRDGIMDVTNSRNVMFDIEQIIPIGTVFTYNVIDTYRIYGNRNIV
jgi:hypothetical protein